MLRALAVCSVAWSIGCATHPDIVGHNSRAQEWAEQQRQEDDARNKAHGGGELPPPPPAAQPTARAPAAPAPATSK
jgi:hypothetical protein